MFDYIRKDDKTFLIISGNEHFKVEFDNDNQREMFVEFTKTPQKKYNKLIKHFKKKYLESEVLSFFKDLKNSGLFYFENFQELENGFCYEVNYEENSKKILKEKTIGLIGFKESNIAKFINQSELSDIIDFIEIPYLKRDNILSFIKGKDLIILDASIYNPNFVSEFNSIIFKEKIPWLYIQGIKNGKGYFGPLFYGEETGCYECFTKRLESNLPYFEEYKKYIDYLKETNKQPSKGRHEEIFDNILSNLIVLEIKKVLLDSGFPHSYGSLIEFDFNKYQTKIHSLYKVPFCSVCYENQNFGKSPWLDPITLKELNYESSE